MNPAASSTSQTPTIIDTGGITCRKSVTTRRPFHHQRTPYSPLPHTQGDISTIKEHLTALLHIHMATYPQSKNNLQPSSTSQGHLSTIKEQFIALLHITRRPIHNQRKPYRPPPHHKATYPPSKNNLQPSSTYTRRLIHHQRTPYSPPPHTQSHQNNT